MSAAAGERLNGCVAYWAISPQAISCTLNDREVCTVNVGMWEWVAILCWLKEEDADGMGRSPAHSKTSTGGTLEEVIHLRPPS